MRIDLFDLIDGVFRGIVYFFYNLAETIFMIVCFPFRGPPYLHRLHVTPGRRQIGSVTLLFLACFLFYPFLAWLWGEIRLSAEEARASLSTFPSLGGDGWWALIAASLVATTLIDAPLRILLRLGRHRRARREAIRAHIEYALFLPLAVSMFNVTILYLLWLFTAAPDPDVEGLTLGWIIAAGLYLLTAAAAIPAGARLAGARYCVPPPPAYVFPPDPVSGGSWAERAARRLRRHRASAATLFLAALVTAATSLGALVGMSIYQPYAAAREALEIRLQRCRTEGDGIAVDLVLRNNRDVPIVIEEGETVVEVGTLQRSLLFGLSIRQEAQVQMRPVGGEAGAPVLIAPGDTQWYRGRQPIRPGADLSGRHCLAKVMRYPVAGEPSALPMMGE